MSRTINMLSKAHTVKAQGVLSAYEELVSLVKNNLGDLYDVSINDIKFADIRHYHTINPWFYFTLPFSKVKSSTVGYVHFLPETLDNSLNLPKIVRKLLYKYVIDFYKKMDYLVTVNPYFIDKLVDYGINREKIQYIPNYVSSSRFYKLDKDIKNSLKKKYNIKNNKFIVLCVGQLQIRKGILEFIEVAKQMSDVQFVWAGGFSFKKISDGYEKIKKILDNPPENVKFLGIIPREDMNELYNMSDMLFLASYDELFPMTILEASNCKLPILLRDIELYKGILDGYYLKGKNVNEFVNQINKLINDSLYYNKAVKMSDKCSKYYSEENVTKMWKSYYNKIYKLSQKKTLGSKFKKGIKKSYAIKEKYKYKYN